MKAVQVIANPASAMFPIEKMQFVTEDVDRWHKAVRGELSFGCEWMVSRFELETKKFDVIEHAKDQMRHELWHSIYGEIQRPLRELEMFALKNATYDLPEVRELVDKLRALTNFPTSGVRPQVSQEATE